MSQQTSTSSAASMRRAQVGEVMSAPLVTCLPGVPLSEVAELMVRHRIHAVVVLDRVAGTPPVTVGREESLERAAFLMADYQVTHLIVVEDGRAAGIVSALDVKRAMAPEPPAPPPPRSDVTSMSASPGVRLVVGPHQLGGQRRDAEILEARGDEGGPPFLVRWEDSGRISLLYPGSDAHVERTVRR